MTPRRDLTLEQKIDLIRENECRLSYRELRDKFHISIGSISNILKRKLEYLDDYELNKNKEVKRKIKNEVNQTINENVYDWFIAQRSNNKTDVSIHFCLTSLL